MIYHAALAAMLIWLAAASGSSAADSAVPQVGEQLATRMLFLESTVLLPPGDWVVAASQDDDTDIASVVLLQSREGRVAGVVLAQGNVTSLKNRPSLSAECWSEQAYFTVVAADDLREVPVPRFWRWTCGRAAAARHGIVPGSSPPPKAGASRPHSCLPR